MADTEIQIVDDNGVIDSFDDEAAARDRFAAYVSGEANLIGRKGDLVLQRVHVLDRSH